MAVSKIGLPFNAFDHRVIINVGIILKIKIFPEGARFKLGAGAGAVILNRLDLDLPAGAIEGNRLRLRARESLFLVGFYQKP
jgi:hypothetical protein